MSEWSGIQRIVRIEGLIIGITAVTAFNYFGGSWLWFFLLIMAPDLGMVGYVLNPRIGSFSYNLLHAYIGPALLLLLILTGELPHYWLLLTLIWLAHIGFDRCLGFGLKYPSSFTETHLQKL